MDQPNSPPNPARGQAEIEELRRRIQTSRSHRSALDDPLGRAELRSVRLQLEYLEPELAFTDLGVEHTIVVFGGTRLLDPEIARQRLASLETAGSGDAHEAALARARAALGRSRYYEIGRELGRIVGSCGGGHDDHRLVVVTGGGPGAMEAANRGAHDVGAASAGLNISLPHEQRPNPYLSAQLSFQFRYFALRKLHFMLRARALVALPGGFGTFDELFETLCLIQTHKRSALPVILIGESFWRRAVDFDFLLEQEMIDPDDLALFEFAETAQEAWQRILRWYEDRGQSLFDDDAPAAEPELPE